MSISLAQAEAMADSFLDSVGSDRLGFRPRETLSALEILAGEFIGDCQKNLKASDSNSTGELSNSLEASELYATGTVMKIDVYMNFYGQFVNAGVRGTKSGRSTGGYAFKKKGPSREFVESIAKWQKHGGQTTANTNPKRTIIRHEKKSASIANLSSAWAVATSIMQRGLKPTGFLDKAATTTDAKVEDRLGAAFEIDIITAITS